MLEIEQWPPADTLEGGHIDDVKPTASGTAVRIGGWVLGRYAKAVAVEIVSGDRTLRVAGLDRPRPDVAAAHPSSGAATNAGFTVHADVRGLPVDFELRVVALLEDGTRVQLGSVRGRRARVQPNVSKAPSHPEHRGPTLKPALEDLISRSLNGRSASAPGGALWDRLELEGQTVLDLGCGFGDLSRAARARGAALVDGFDRDQNRIRVARLLNAYHDVTRVSYYERDVSDPESYSEPYDIVLALSVPTEVAGVVSRLANITRRLLVVGLFGSEAEDSSLLASIEGAFPRHEIAGAEAGEGRYVIAYPDPEAGLLR